MSIYDFADKHIIFSFFALMMITAVVAAFKAIGLGVALRALREKKDSQ